MAKGTRKQRKGVASHVAVDGEETIVSLITRLPFELIAEILLYSTTPADVLSLSRTCKHFCATLVENPAATFIWKHVRAQTKPPVPDPTKLGFSEPQLANFIYGGGNCVVCGKRTNNMYTSFSARVRLCGDPVCRENHLGQRTVFYGVPPPYALWLPWIEWAYTEQPLLEVPFVISNGRVTIAGVGASLHYDRDRLLEARNEYNKAALATVTLNEFKQRKQKYVDGLGGYMNGCLELCKWKWSLTGLQGTTATYNRMQLEEFAIIKRQRKSDIQDTPTVVQLLREKLLDLGKITADDLELLWPMIEADLSRIESHRKIVEIEHSRTRRYHEVERLYRELDHTKFNCFPSLPQFRKLPTLRAFQESTLDVKSTEWRNEFVETLIKNDVREWATKTVQAFSELLGHLEWPSTKDLVHPVHRFSSLFICTRCSKSGPKVARNKSLSFRDAAHHICLIPEEGNKDRWSPKNFIVDTKAAALVTRFATAVGVDAEEKTAADLLAVSRDIMCLSCSAPIVMGFDAMIQHSHRHDDMQFMILADEELVKFSDYPVLPGVTAKLVRTNDKAKEQRRKVRIGCKHCISNPLAAGETKVGSDGEVSKSSKKPKRFMFDGLRSHLKEKHKVVEIADEDLFVFGEHLEELGYNT